MVILIASVSQAIIVTRSDCFSVPCDRSPSILSNVAMALQSDEFCPSIQIPVETRTRVQCMRTGSNGELGALVSSAVPGSLLDFGALCKGKHTSWVQARAWGNNAKILFRCPKCKLHFQHCQAT
jgi:hypothetical protein